MNAFNYDNCEHPHPKEFKAPIIFHLVTGGDRKLVKAAHVLAKHHLTFADFADVKLKF